MRNQDLSSTGVSSLYEECAISHLMALGWFPLLPKLKVYEEWVFSESLEAGGTGTGKWGQNTRRKMTKTGEDMPEKKTQRKEGKLARKCAKMDEKGMMHKALGGVDGNRSIYWTCPCIPNLETREKLTEVALHET